ncbi:MAG: type II toxin-antitoxin system RelE/ParE family toxin [Candidatus Aminicenantales bacterium]
MAYEVIWQAKVLEDLEAIDRKAAAKIVERVKTYLVQNPAGLGTPLKGIFKGLFRYRYGMYRIIYAIDMAENKIIVLHVKHRKEAYR